MKSLGEKLQKFRVKSNKTQREVADELGITQVHISRIEQGKSNPSGPLISRIATLIGEKIRLSNLQIHNVKDKDWTISYFVMADELSGDRVFINNKKFSNCIYLTHVDSEGHNAAAIRASNTFHIVSESIIYSSSESDTTTPSFLLKSLDSMAKNLKSEWPVSSSCNIFSLKRTQGLVTFINAGMPSIYFYNSKKRAVEKLDGITKVKPVGELSKNSALADTSLLAKKGDVIASFSDGFLEFFRRVHKGSIDEYLVTFSRTLRGDAEGISSKLLKDMVADENKRGISDDISFLIIGKV